MYFMKFPNLPFVDLCPEKHKAHLNFPQRCRPLCLSTGEPELRVNNALV